MSMDLASFTGEMKNGGVHSRLKAHTSAPKPPDVSTIQAMAYVDTYIKAFYLPPTVSASVSEGRLPIQNMFSS